MSIVRIPHSINGKKRGVFYSFAGTERLYLAYRSGAKNRALHFNSNSWCLDTDTLREAERRGCKWIGVAHKIGTNKFDYYITPLKDFWGELSERHPDGDRPSRRLNRYHFQIRVSKYGVRGGIVKTEEKAITLGR